MSVLRYKLPQRTWAAFPWWQ